RDDAEGGEMPLVEHDRVAQSDRPRVVGGGIDQIEDLLRAGPVAAVPGDGGGTVYGNGGSHDRRRGAGVRHPESDKPGNGQTEASAAPPALGRARIVKLTPHAGACGRLSWSWTPP